MQKLILVGAGGHCKSCIDVIESQKKYKIIGLIDNKKRNKNEFNYPIIGSLDFLNGIDINDFSIVLAVGDCIKRKKLLNGI